MYHEKKSTYLFVFAIFCLFSLVVVAQDENGERLADSDRSSTGFDKTRVEITRDGRVMKYWPDGKLMFILGRNGKANSLKSLAPFSSAVAVKQDGNGRILVLDGGAKSVYIYNYYGQFLEKQKVDSLADGLEYLGIKDNTERDVLPAVRTKYYPLANYVIRKRIETGLDEHFKLYKGPDNSVYCASRLANSTLLKIYNSSGDLERTYTLPVRIWTMAVAADGQTYDLYYYPDPYGTYFWALTKKNSTATSSVALRTWTVTDPDHMEDISLQLAADGTLYHFYDGRFELGDQYYLEQYSAAGTYQGNRTWGYGDGPNWFYDVFPGGKLFFRAYNPMPTNALKTYNYATDNWSNWKAYEGRMQGGKVGLDSSVNFMMSSQGRSPEHFKILNSNNSVYDTVGLFPLTMGYFIDPHDHLAVNKDKFWVADGTTLKLIEKYRFSAYRLTKTGGVKLTGYVRDLPKDEMAGVLVRIEGVDEDGFSIYGETKLKSTGKYIFRRFPKNASYTISLVGLDYDKYNQEPLTISGTTTQNEKLADINVLEWQGDALAVKGFVRMNDKPNDPVPGVKITCGNNVVYSRYDGSFIVPVAPGTKKATITFEREHFVLRPATKVIKLKGNITTIAKVRAFFVPEK